VWLEGLGEWSWPGARVATAEVLPPAWVPASPPAARPAASAAPLPARWQRARRLLIAVLLCAVAAVGGALALRRQLGLQPALAPAVQTAGAKGPLLPAPVLHQVSRASSGSVIDHATYHSVALHGGGSFYVYLPPGYRRTSARYPVLYLLHGNSQRASAFLEVGLQGELDRLIGEGAIPPLIAVLIQGGPGANNWRNIGDQYYESYVLEVQEIADGLLPTRATRAGRAIAGVSMGGYGAMELALDNPDRFSVVESWLGFFNGLEGRLRLDRRAISTLGLHAFLYGAQQDRIADPSEDAPFAAALRAEGAQARSAVYPGEHDLQTVHAHLGAMLSFAGRALRAPTRG
jgi:S-formylglutathione hydrolase FrmB